MLSQQKFRAFIFATCSINFFMVLPNEAQSLLSQKYKKASNKVVSFSFSEDNNSNNIWETEANEDPVAPESLPRVLTEETFEKTNTLEQEDMSIPIVINTWDFTVGNDKAWEVLSQGGSALDAVEKGATTCEELQCDTTVGYGGSPDENGETTLDAMIMDGEKHAIGAVGCLRRVKSAVSVARKVMENTGHTLLVGELATDFALKMGFKEENLTTDVSTKMHADWKAANCQPNFWRNVKPDPTKYCGPYSASTLSSKKKDSKPRAIDRYNHDTIGILAIDSLGRIAVATSSNGARNKIPGRVGDAPIPGAGGYVDREIGGAAATGDGDIMVRFLPSLVAVEKMRSGLSPREAAVESIARIVKYYPNFSGALVAVNILGEYGAACHGISNGFPYCVSNGNITSETILHVSCT